MFDWISAIVASMFGAGETAAEDILGTGDEGGSDEGKGMPGFGIFAAASAIGIAAIAIRKQE